MEAKLFLCLINHLAMKLCGEVEIWLHKCLTAALDGGVCQASRPSRFITEEGAPSTHHKGRFVDPRAGLDTVAKRKALASAGNLTPDSSAVQPTAQSLYHHNHPDSLYTG
jgi:hypothetical protein